MTRGVSHRCSGRDGNPSFLCIWRFFAVNRFPAPHFYFLGEAVQAFLSNMAWIIFPVYCVLAAHLNPLQLVLLGTTFELTTFLFEVPTGLVADAYGRRLSVIAGWSLLGAALVL